jgi:carbamoyltransferase
MTPDWILALGGSEHDYSAALANGRNILVAVEQERVSRRKHGFALWYERPIQEAIEYCLATEQISINDVAMTVSSDSLPTRLQHAFRGNALRQFPHHLCHAASAYMMLPPGTRSGVLVYDGFGSVRGKVANDPLRNKRETFSFFLFGPNGYECLGTTVGLSYIEHDDFPTGVTNSIGMLYEIVNSLLGYDLMDSGKTMGLSSHGVPQYLDLFEEFVSYGSDETDCFRCSLDDSRLVSELRRVLLTDRDSFVVRADLAASLQALVNKTLLHCAEFFFKHDIEYLCLAGGCALNSVANSHLVDHLPSRINLMIPPHCGDSGLGFGALWLEHFTRIGVAPELTFRGGPSGAALARPGRRYKRAECRQAAQQFYPRIALDSSVTSADGLAKVIAEGAIVGVLNGSSEIGPRALGGRSIFADPSSAMTRERVNRLIKKREPFRPLAPIVLQSDYEHYFCDIRCADPYMLRVARVRESCLLRAPAIVHVDGTARVQIVMEDGDPFLIELLSAFRAATGLGILLNTSFNRRGEPIVESPLDALDAFLGMNLDGLYLDGEFYRAVSINPNT